MEASDAAADQDLPENIRQRFQNILKNVEVEVQLIDDLLDLSRISHGKLKLNMQTLDVHEVLNDTLRMVRRELEDKHIRLTAKLNAERHVILADSVRLQQVFWNILRNAIKFTGVNGEIDIETSSTVEKFTVTVKDSGIGMTPDEISRAFSPFAQGDHAHGGLGLGLAISKKVVDLHLGHIQASSAGRGHGSCISIEFPVANTLNAASDVVLAASNAQEHQANPSKSALVSVLRTRQ